jgi:hypothetical protein
MRAFGRNQIEVEKEMGIVPPVMGQPRNCHKGRNATQHFINKHTGKTTGTVLF